MKKFFVSFALLVAASATSVFAQSPLVATLNHNDTISVYYGIDALQSAYSASVNGDVITLSSGGFNAPSKISKNITLRGAGMEQDSINKVAPTVLIGSFNVYSQYATSSTEHLTIEGIWHDGTIYFGYSNYPYYGLRDAQFIKCRLGHFQNDPACAGLSPNSFALSSVAFVQCKIKSVKAHGNATFLNCYVRYPMSSNSSFTMNYECINCVVYGSLDPTDIKYSTFTNSVLIGSNPLDATNMAYNCIGVYTAKSDTVNHLFTNLPYGLSNVCYRKVGEVFDTKTFFADGTGYYSDADTYQLLDSIRTKYLGTDGREVGMYGGALPFNTQSTLPKIKKFSVAPQTDSEGKLKVEIEVSAAGK